MISSEKADPYGARVAILLKAAADPAGARRDLPKAANLPKKAWRSCQARKDPAGARMGLFKKQRAADPAVKARGDLKRCAYDPAEKWRTCGGVWTLPVARRTCEGRSRLVRADLLPEVRGDLTWCAYDPV
ncbi:hypothetical protein AAFF_G00104120 [Aldrovandia affinis]|uniref:Uncharacterized protein n=1 Tax=Aldrovandia affinis TaxID=143900 RepID=A0AAD7R164_9TELE|nr:hypothetical protein AAFF_G00104120 [Aldrovandia affinis]